MLDYVLVLAIWAVKITAIVDQTNAIAVIGIAVPAVFDKIVSFDSHKIHQNQMGSAILEQVVFKPCSQIRQPQWVGANLKSNHNRCGQSM